MFPIFVVHILLVCLLHDVDRVVANPVASTSANGCSCSDVKDITSETALKLEEYIDQSMDGLLDSVDAVVSKSISLAVREELESILHTYSLTNDSQLLVLGRLENMTVQQMVNFEGVKLQIEAIRNEMGNKIEDLKMQQLALVNSTLREFQMKSLAADKNETSSEKELRDEIRDIKDVVSIILAHQQQTPTKRPAPQPQRPTESAMEQVPASSSNGTGIATSAPHVFEDVMRITSSAELMGSYEHPVNSCRDLPESYPSGDYFLLNNCNKIPVKVFCDMTRTACNITGGWNRIAMLNMTDSNHSCPGALKPITHDTSPERLCGGAGGCTSAVLNAHGIRYSRVCGRIKGYQFGAPNAFYYHTAGIDSYYVEGVSLTYRHLGKRKHIWSFAIGADELTPRTFNCPCTRTDLTWPGTIPSFVGDNYFCDTANHDQLYAHVYGKEVYNDPLWDGNGCISTSSCCCHNNPPFFCTELPESTIDDVELRICNGQSVSRSDTRIEIVEIYVQ